MSYFIGFLIFVATFATTNQALAVDVLTPVSADSIAIIKIAYVILVVAVATPLLCVFIRLVIIRLGREPYKNFDYFANKLVYGVLIAMWVLFILLTMAFVKVMINPTWLSMFCELLGTTEKDDTLAFIGFAMGGVLAAVNGIMLHLRAKK